MYSGIIFYGKTDVFLPQSSQSDITVLPFNISKVKSVLPSFVFHLAPLPYLLLSM